ncbi:MAG: hypothetical protein Q8M08_06085 [Bacteroidales bacterium]|nr:hypothetical protein [Bacteroidales bacterium]
MHRHHSLRLTGYDYSSAGLYFITICTKDRLHYFGTISNGEMILNETGRTAELFLEEVSIHFSHARAMSPPPGVPPLPGVPPPANQFGQPIAGSVSVIINQYKSSVKRWCNKNGHNFFQWQPRFHDHIIRNKKSYQNIVNYIRNNPKLWKEERSYLK